MFGCRGFPAGQNSVRVVTRRDGTYRPGVVAALDVPKRKGRSDRGQSVSLPLRWVWLGCSGRAVRRLTGCLMPITTSPCQACNGLRPWSAAASRSSLCRLQPTPSSEPPISVIANTTSCSDGVLRRSIHKGSGNAEKRCWSLLE